MSKKSSIEWTDRTWNPLSGCSKVSKGCKNCYAERIFNRPYPGRRFTDVQMHPERLGQPLSWKKPKLVFVNSMSDLFHEAVPDEFIDQVFAVMALAEQHTFQILTKRPERMLAYLSAGEDRLDAIWDAYQWAIHKFLYENPRVSNKEWGKPKFVPWPLPNVMLGVSVEDQETADYRIPRLLQTPAAARFISCEPMIGPVDLTGWLSTDGGPRIDWVIAGGESGPNARPMHAAWVRAIRDQCLSADAPFFFKQWGEYVTGRIIPDDSFDGGAVVETESRGLYAISISHRLDDEFAAVRVGKKYAGRHLDGRLWEEYPDIVEIHPQKKRR